MNESRFEKVLWAVDPFLEVETTHHLVPVLLGIQKAGSTMLEACAVLKPRELPQKEAAKAALQRMLAPFRPDVETHATVLVDPLESTGSAVQLLLEHAEKAGADLIAASTHARTGVDRFFLGSFVETLLMRSPLPVLTVNPKATSHPLIGRILFATDFSPDSKKAMSRVLALAKGLGAAVHVFHGVRPPGTTLLGPPGIVDFTRIEHRLADETEILNGWLKRLEPTGTEVTGEASPVASTLADSLCEKAEESKARLIALHTRAPALGIGLGSSVRQVVRRADCPVLVIPAR